MIIFLKSKNIFFFFILTVLVSEIYTYIVGQKKKTVKKTKPFFIICLFGFYGIINLCRLSNAKSVFIQVNFYFKQFGLA